MKKKIHFGWFVGTYYGPHGWNAPYAPIGYDWRQPEIYQNMASICEKGMFDLVLFADRLGISTTYQGSVANYVKYGLDGLAHDSTVLAAMIAAKTKHIGIGTTVTTSLTPPYILARQVASLDHLTKGRIAWNVVTTGDISGYLNMGIDEMLGETEEVAKLKMEFQRRPSEQAIQAGLAALSSRTGIDFSQFNLNEPLPVLDENSIQGGHKFNALGHIKTLRQIAMESFGSGLSILGNPEQVADQLQELMEKIGGDGYCIRVDAHNHAYMTEFVNTVIPILQERDLARKEYTGKTLREHFLEF